MFVIFFFIFLGYGAHRDLNVLTHSFPTRLSSDLEEIACLKASVAVCEEAIGAMRAALVPGMTENALWSILNQVNAARGGEWIETRLLAAGPRDRKSTRLNSSH